MKTMIQIQQDYMDTVSAGRDRWMHRRDGGHSGRIQHGARRKAMRRLTAMGFTEPQARQIVQDAHDMMLLERAGVDDDLNFEQGEVRP